MGTIRSGIEWSETLVAATAGEAPYNGGAWYGLPDALAQLSWPEYGAPGVTATAKHPICPLDERWVTNRSRHVTSLPDNLTRETIFFKTCEVANDPRMQSGFAMCFGQVCGNCANITADATRN